MPDAQCPMPSCPRTFPEAAMSEPISRWLAGQGFTVYTEVPDHYGMRKIDVVGLDGAGGAGGRIVIVELKVRLTEDLVHQAMQVQTVTSEVWCAVSTAPRKSNVHLEMARRAGLGVLLVVPESMTIGEVTEPGFRITELLTPRETCPPSKHAAAKLLARCARMTAGGTGGMPSTKGVGPAQTCLELVKQFRKSNPGCRWPEIFEKVPNHYTSAKSMQSAMANQAKWNRIRDSRREAASQNRTAQ